MSSAGRSFRSGFVAVLVVALAASACGGGGGTGQLTSADAAAATAGAAAGGSAGSTGGDRDDAGGAGSQDGGAAAGETQPNAAGEEGRSAAGQDLGPARKFLTPGGDNSVQTFGGESAGGEREAASATLEEFMRARAAGDWAAECKTLAAERLQPLERIAKETPGFEDKPCGDLLAALEANASAAVRANTMTGPIASLRVDGDQAFALYHGRGGADYFMPMIREGGRWLVAAFNPFEFPRAVGD